MTHMKIDDMHRVADDMLLCNGTRGMTGYDSTLTNCPLCGRELTIKHET